MCTNKGVSIYNGQSKDQMILISLGKDNDTARGSRKVIFYCNSSMHGYNRQ
jgi:hypothetical protein